MVINERERPADFGKLWCCALVAQVNPTKQARAHEDQSDDCRSDPNGI